MPLVIRHFTSFYPVGSDILTQGLWPPLCAPRAQTTDHVPRSGPKSFRPPCPIPLTLGLRCILSPLWRVPQLGALRIALSLLLRHYAPLYEVFLSRRKTADLRSDSDPGVAARHSSHSRLLGRRLRPSRASLRKAGLFEFFSSLFQKSSR